jgi:hypothetical protein
VPTPGGPARARKWDSLSARGDIIFFVDADVAVPPDIVCQISAVFQQQPDLAAVFGSYDDQPTETNFFSQYRNLLHHFAIGYAGFKVQKIREAAVHAQNLNKLKK